MVQFPRPLRGGSGAGFFFFFNDTATTEIYTLSLHDALPISSAGVPSTSTFPASFDATAARPMPDRKSTRLNSSHGYISYAVFCLKKNTCSKLLTGSAAKFLPAKIFATDSTSNYDGKGSGARP